MSAWLIVHSSPRPWWQLYQPDAAERLESPVTANAPGVRPWPPPPPARGRWCRGAARDRPRRTGSSGTTPSVLKNSSLRTLPALATRRRGPLLDSRQRWRTGRGSALHDRALRLLPQAKTLLGPRDRTTARSISPRIPGPRRAHRSHRPDDVPADRDRKTRRRRLPRAPRGRPRRDAQDLLAVGGSPKPPRRSRARL